MFKEHVAMLEKIWMFIYKKVDSHKQIYKFWLESSSLSEAEKEVIKGYSDEQIPLFFNEKPFHFGTAGVRRKVGIAPQLWNIYTYRLLASGYGEYIKQRGPNKRVLVSHDNRPNGDKYALAIAEVLRAKGLEVYLAPNNESMPTPIVSYWIRKLSLSGAINVTASHNPVDDNGFKSYNSKGYQTSNEDEQFMLEQTPKYQDIFAVKTTCGCCCSSKEFKYLDDDYVEQYFSELCSVMPGAKSINRDLRVLFSSHHGTSSKLMLNLAKKCGFEGFVEYEPECTTVFKLNEGESLNPEDKKSFNSSGEYAEQHGINYQIAHDPDSDRNAVVERQKDGSWYFFNGNEMAILAADYIVANSPSTKGKYVVTTYVSGNFIKKVCPSNVEMFVTKTGLKNISPVIDRCEEEGKSLLIGFEEAIGAVICPINREKDGFQMSLLFLNMISHYLDKNLSLKDRLETLYKEHGYWIGKTEYFISKETNWKELFAEKMQKTLQHPLGDLLGYEVETIHFNKEGDCAEFLMKNDNWIKFRLSGTEPKFKIYYNLFGNSQKEINQKIDQFREYFKTYLGF